MIVEKKAHIPVMLKEVLEYLKPKENALILDATFGAGGYTKAILDNSLSNVYGTDRDINVKVFADNIKEEYKNRFDFFNLKFSEIKESFQDNFFDGIVLDLGVSSMQLDNQERGFSFNKEAPLSMCMGKNKITAFELVNSFRESEIADILYNYGDETKSREIAKRISIHRKHKVIETTTQLADIIRSCFNGRREIDNATKSFQAIRIYVNDEMNELKTILEDAKSLLKKDGRLVVVTFHSLEDKIVKEFIKANTELSVGKINKYREGIILDFKCLTKKAVKVSNEEIKKNIRSRSSKLRGMIKC